MFGLEGNRLAFPIRYDALRGAQLLGELPLGQSGLLPGVGDTFTEGGALGLGRSALSHVPTISVVPLNIRNRLHKYTNSVYIGGMSKSFASGLTHFGGN